MPEMSGSPGRMYAAVIAVEIITIGALWFLGRLYA